MSKKYERYINYIVNDIEKPYFNNMRDHYGLKSDEYKLILSKLFNQPVTIKGNYVYDNNGNKIYYENSTGYWTKKEYDTNGKVIYYEDSTGHWYKKEYDTNNNEIYFENTDGVIIDKRYE
jgi:hypothetical protein